MYLLQAKGVPKLAGAAPKRLNVRSFLLIQFGLVCRQVYAGVENKESQKERREKREREKERERERERMYAANCHQKFVFIDACVLACM